MNRINSERSEEKDFTDGTTKRRISSILKAPRTPLRDLGIGNELIQEGIVEKCQKTSRRVSFAETIRVFPPDPQTTVELNHAELIGEPRHHQEAFPEKDDLDVVPCEITGMNTLLHAPIQTPLQQMEVFDAYSCPERNKMDKTFIFLAENEMDMTYDRTIMITHDVRDCQESGKSGKIDFKSFSAELKSKKETSQVNKASFFSCPTMMNDTCLSQHKINTEKRHKIKFGDFLQSLKSIKQLPTPTDEMVASNNVLQEKTYNAITVSRQLDDNRQKYKMPVLTNNNSVMFASKHLEFQEITPAAGEESVEMFIPNREMGLPLGTRLNNIVNEQENLQQDHSMNCNMNSSRLNASHFRLGIQQDSSRCINGKNVNYTEASTEQKDTIMVTKSDTTQPHNRTNAMSVPIVSATSMAAQPEATTTMFSSCMELTNNGTDLIWDGNSTRMGCPFPGDPEKQKNDVFQLERPTGRENHMNIPANSFPKSTQLSNFCNEKAAPNQEFTYNNAELLSTRINQVPQASYLPEKKTNCFPGEESSRSSVFFPRNGSSNSNFVSKGSKKQTASQFLSLSDMAQTSTVYSKINRRLSNSAVCLVPEDKTATFIFSEDMEITKYTTKLSSNNPDAVVFNKLQCEKKSQGFSLQPIDETVYMCDNMDETKAITGILYQPMESVNGPDMHKQTNESVRRTLTGSTKERSSVFLHSGENGVEITRSYTVPLNHDAIIQGEKISITSFVPANKMDVFAVGEDMDISQPFASITDKSLRRVTDSFAVLEPKAKPDKKTGGLASDIVYSLSEDNDMEFTKCLIGTIEGGLQALSPTPPEKTLSLHCSGMATCKSVPFVPADKTVFFLHNNEMETTKPTACGATQDSGLKKLEWNMQESGKVIVSETAKEELTAHLHEVCEMEITRSHDILLQPQLTTQGPISGLADKTNTPANSKSAITLSTSYVPVDKTMLLMDNNDMEITKSVSEVILNNSNLASLSQEGQKTRESTLTGLVKDKTSVALHDDEMESRNCHKAAVNYDMLPKSEKNPQKLCCQDNMAITGSHTVNENTKELHKTSTKLGKHAEWNLSSKHMVASAMADDKEGSKRHKLEFDCERSLHYLPASHAKFPFSVSETSEFTSYQDGTEVTNLPPNTVDNQDLEESVTQEMPDRNIEQHLINVLPLVYGGKTQDTEFAGNHTVNIYGSNNDVPNTESQIQNLFTESRGAENLERTKNYTTGTKCVHMNKNECHLNSHDKSNSVFSALAVTCEKKLDTTETEKAEYSICSATGMLVDTQSHQNFLKIKDNQLKSCTSKINNFEKDTTSILSSKDDAEKLPWPRQKPSEETSDLSDDGKVTNRYEATSGEWSSYTEDWQNNVKSLPINTFPSEEKPVLLSNISGAANSSSKLRDTGKKSPPALLSQNVESCLGDALPGFTLKSDNPSVLKEDAEDSNIPSKEWTNNGFTEPLSTVFTENRTIKKLPLGIFPPKLPNKRKSLYYADDSDVRSEKRKINQSGKSISNLSPSSYINEELLPAYIKEMDSDEFLNCDVLENVCEEMNGKEAAEKEGYLSKIYESGKRPRDLIQEDEELQKEKMFKGNQDWNHITDFKQPMINTMVAHSQAPTHEDKNVPEVTVINLEKTGSSNSSSLDSVQRTELETQLLLDNICEQNLQEKLQDGTITVREFFTLLEVHVLIQKPRQSQLPLKYEVNTTPTLEDEILSQYLFHPKLQEYKEDCQGLCKIIEELKSHAVDQDKLLIHVHKSFWEVMRTCSDEELKGFGAELNKMKSCFTKKSKVLAHRGKANLYAKLVQSTQFQWENLQSRLTKIDELLKETDRCLVALEKETAALEEHELEFYSATSEYETKLRNTERELENLRVQDETLQRAQSNLRDKKEQLVSEICHTQKDVESCQELVEKYKYSFSAWVIKEWTDYQAVFTFLYDSIELTVGLDCPAGGALCSNRIVSVNLESLLDEAKALPSAKLAHRLIFQFINSQGSWKEKCLTVPDLSQMLHDVSLVVSRCQNLREEIEFLNRWGGKYYLLKTELNDTKLKLLFSGFRAKFEIEVSLSANYPMSPVTFTIQKRTGNLLQEEISEVLSSVPVGVNYLKRLVKQISDSLFQHPPSRPASS